MTLLQCFPNISATHEAFSTGFRGEGLKIGVNWINLTDIFTFVASISYNAEKL